MMTRFNIHTLLSRRSPPSIPSHHSEYAVHSYTRSDLRLLSTPNHFFFPTPKSDLLRKLTDTTKSHIRSLDNIQGLKTQKDLISFDIYPTCHHHLSINKLLHEAAQRGSFDPAALEAVLGAHVLVLAIAPELHQFLAMTSKEEVDTAIIDFLVLLHHQLDAEGDAEGVRRLMDDLEPSISARVHQNIGKFPDGEPPEGRRANVLEQIVQLAFLTPWRVDVWGAYLTSVELRGLGSGIGVTGDVSVAKLAKDWIVFSDMLHSITPDWGIADGLERAICEGKIVEIFSRAKLVSRLVGDVKSMLHGLPKDVVEGYLIPWLVRSECEALPSRRRQIAPLECTPAGVRFLDELEAAGEDVIDRLAIDRDGLTLWREWAAAYGTGLDEKQDLCFSLDRKPWISVGEDLDASLDSKDLNLSFRTGSEDPDRENSSLGRSFIRNRRFLS